MPAATSTTIPALDKITYRTVIPGYNVSFTLLSAMGTAEVVLPTLKATVDAIIAKGTVKELHKDVHPWLEYELPCEQYAQMMVRFDVFQACQAQLQQLLGGYMSLPTWRKPPLITEAQWRANANVSVTDPLAIAEQREELKLGADEWPDMRALAAWSKQRAILFRTWHDLVAKYVELAMWATNIQPLFMYPGEAQKQPTPEGWFTSGLGVPKPVRELLEHECMQRGGTQFSYWQDNPGILGGSVNDSDRKAAFYKSFHTSTHSWFPGHPASAAVFAPFRRGVNVLKLVRGKRDGMVWEAAHWDELDRYQNLNHRAFPVHAYEAWAGPESMRPGMVPNWIGAYPSFMLDYARSKMPGKAPIPWQEGDHPLDGETTHAYTPNLSRMVINRAGEAAIPDPPTKRERRRRRFRRFMRWIISPATAMARDIENRRDQAEPQKSIVNTLEFIDSLPDAELEDLYWSTCAVDGEKLDDEWFEAWEDPRKYHLGARLRDVQQEIRRANALVPVTTMGPRMRLKWARAWAQGVAYQDATTTFREAMNLYFDGHITFFTARGDLELDAAAREAMAIAKAKANGQKVTQAIGAVAALAAAINPIAGAIVAVVAALVGLFTNLFGGSVKADNFRLTPQTPVLRQPKDPNQCVTPEEAPAVAAITAQTSAQTPESSNLGYIAAAAAAAVLGFALFRKKKP